MARAEAVTLLSLDRFARILGAHPLHWNGVFHDLAPVTTCGQPLMQYDWQVVDGISRESIALAIQDAEARISQYLGFKPLPTFEVDERHPLITPANPALYRTSLVGGAVGTQLDWGHLVAGGIEARTPISLNASITYTDEDLDGYAETATVQAPAVGIDADEICAFFPGEGADPSFEIRPIKVNVATGIATITMRREQLVIPALQERLDSTRAIDGSDNANFLTIVDVYRVWHDPQQQVQFLWRNWTSSCGCGGTACPSCYLSAQFGCTTVADYRLSIMTGQPAFWDAPTGQYVFTPYAVPRQPDSARFWYRAGYRDKTRARPMRDMDPRWERAIAAYAVTFLDRPFCACRNVENISNHWGQDMAKMTPNEGASRLGAKWIDNPLGTTRGAIHAWRLIRTEALGDAANP